MSAPENMEVSMLNSLPIEILLIIFDNIDTNTLIRSLMHVNKQFYNIIRDKYLWKKRAKRTFIDRAVVFMMTNTYNENTFNWRKFNWHTERETNYWSNHEKNTIVSTYESPHYSKVDGVLLNKYGTRCLSAMGNRSICLWDIMTRDKKPMVYKANSHKSKICSIKSYDDNLFLSCSWDRTVKIWDMFTFSKTVIPEQIYETESAVLSVTSKNNFIVAGLKVPKVVAFDPRTYESIFQLEHHTNSVVDLCLVKDYFLVSLSKDQYVSVCDLRTHQTVIAKNLSEHTTRFPIRACYYEDILFVSDSQDYVHWLDCSDGSLRKIQTLQYSMKDEIDKSCRQNCIVCTNYGSIITGGNNGYVTITTPTIPPKILKKFINFVKFFNFGISSMDYKNDTLVMGFENNKVQIWQRNDL